MKILMFYDGTGYAKEALAAVKKRVNAFKAKVDLVSSLSGGDASQRDKIMEMNGSLMDMKAVLERENIPCETHILARGLNAGDEIVCFAEEHKVDEIIIGAEKRTRFQKLVLGSAAQYVMLNAGCPVVIL